MDYVLITAAKNEEAYIDFTLRSVCSQTRLPKNWIIVNDNSTDRTEELIRKYAEKNNFITLLNRTGDQKRNFGSQVHSINAGFEMLKTLEFDLVGNIDADISFEPHYFETLVKTISNNPQLGIVGGWIQEKQNDIFCDRKSNSLNSVPHAVQLFRRECFEQIGGYKPFRNGGPDWYAEVLARKNGWEVKPFKDLKVGHHRTTNAAEKRFHAAWREGQLAYSIGSHPVLEIVKTGRRFYRRPFVLFSLARLLSYSSSYLLKKKREVSDDFKKYIRKEQIARLLHSAKQNKESE